MGRHELRLNKETILSDIQFSFPNWPADASLRFLSLVDTDRIPLHLILGSACEVSIPDVATASWFNGVLVNQSSGAEDEWRWWQAARSDSPLGVLAAIEGISTAASIVPKPTEILFYAANMTDPTQRQLTPPASSPSQRSGEPPSSIKFYALLLSSDLLLQGAELSPPPSPGREEDVSPVFLPHKFPTTEATIHEPPTKKRRTADDAFEEAAQRRKQARRSVVRKDSVERQDALHPRVPSLKQQMSKAGSASPRPRPISRSTSALSTTSRQGSVTGQAAPPDKRSSLSHVQNVESDPADKTQAVEESNKQLISRLVMAGMRLYGLVQSRSRKGKAALAGPSTAIDGEDDNLESDRRDEEYKLVYHQVFKGACFAFRQHICTFSLSANSEVARELVDKLLQLYCNDPLAGESVGNTDELTPETRKGFGTAQQMIGDRFADNVVETEVTPSSRRARPLQNAAR